MEAVTKLNYETLRAHTETGHHNVSGRPRVTEPQDTSGEEKRREEERKRKREEIRRVVCTGCGSVQATVSCLCVMYVSCAWSAAVCHGASESTHLPALRCDTRSRRATHTLLRSLQVLHSEVPRLPSLTVNQECLS